MGCNPTADFRVQLCDWRNLTANRVGVLPSLGPLKKRLAAVSREYPAGVDPQDTQPVCPDHV
jgi:hypothetical protein